MMAVEYKSCSWTAVEDDAPRTDAVGSWGNVVKTLSADLVFSSITPSVCGCVYLCVDINVYLEYLSTQ